MAIIEQLIRLEANNTISFGNYLETTKQKVLNFEATGDLYKIKTYNEITRLEKNGSLLFEAVPGCTVHNLALSETRMSFDIEGFDHTQITIELEDSTEYKIIVDDVTIDKLKTNLSGKINFSLGLNQTSKLVIIEKLG